MVVLFQEPLNWGMLSYKKSILAEIAYFSGKRGNLLEVKFPL